MLGLPAAATSVGNQSRPEKMPFSMTPGLMWPGQRAIAGDAEPPSKTVPLVARKGVMPPSGQVKTSAPLSVVKIRWCCRPRRSPPGVLEFADTVVDLGHAGLLVL